MPPARTGPLPAPVAALELAAAELEQRRRREGSASLTLSLPAPDEVGAFVAEMELPLADPVREAVTRALADGRTGYLSDVDARAVGEACAAFAGQRYGWQLDPDAVVVVPDVIGALRLTIDHLLPAGLPVVLPVPAYMPFLEVPAERGRELRTVPLRPVDGRWVLDPDELRRALRGGGLLVLVDPHNPTGQVATAAELAAVTDVVDSCGALVFADAIHAPLVHAGHRHLPYATTSPTAAGHTVTALSASKGWNLPGLPCAQLVPGSAALRDRVAALSLVATHGATPLGAAATVAAYRDGTAHLDTVLGHLAAGGRLFADRLADLLPAVGHRPPEATYLHWLDLRPLGVDPADVRRRTGVVGTDGKDCGTRGLLRLALARSHAVVLEVADRLGRLSRSGAVGGAGSG